MFDILIDPFTTGQVRRWHSVWKPSNTNDLGIRRTELFGDLEKAVARFMGKSLTPELTAEIKETVIRVAKAFEARHEDIRFTRSEIEIQFGNFNFNLDIERSGVAIKTVREIHPLLQAELSSSTYDRTRPDFSRVAVVNVNPLVISDPEAAGKDLERLVRDLVSVQRFVGETDEELRERATRAFRE